MSNALKAADKIYATDGVKCLSLDEIEAIIQSAIEADRRIVEARNQANLKSLQHALIRIGELEEQIRNSAESFKAVMEEKCPTDEIHCTCVPFLRERITELEGTERDLTEQLDIYGRELQGKDKRIDELTKAINGMRSYLLNQGYMNKKAWSKMVSNLKPATTYKKFQRNHRNVWFCEFQDFIMRAYGVRVLVMDGQPEPTTAIGEEEK